MSNEHIRIAYFRHLFKLTIALSLVLLAGCTTIYNPATKRRETYFITEQAELSMGKNLAQKVMRDHPLVKENRMLSYVREVGGNVARTSDRNNIIYTFNIIDSNELNAFALPGGYVFVNKGLVERGNRDELAFVLGHEIGHIAARHSLKRMQAALGLNLIMDLAFQKPQYSDLRQAVGIVYQAVASGYSRQDELLADSLGVEYSKRAGFDPKGAVSMMERLNKESKDKSFAFFSSHPPPETRIKNLQAKIRAFSADQAENALSP